MSTKEYNTTFGGWGNERKYHHIEVLALKTENGGVFQLTQPYSIMFKHLRVLDNGFILKQKN